MKTSLAVYSLGLLLFARTGAQTQSPLPSTDAAIPVTVDNFIRAETEMKVKPIPGAPADFVPKANQP